MSDEKESANIDDGLKINSIYSGMPLFKEWDLIINYPTGVIHENYQCGGMACHMTKTEGLLVKVNIDKDLNDCEFCCWFEIFDSLNDMSIDEFEDYNARKESADKINSILKESTIIAPIGDMILYFDYDNIHKLTEAWIPVIVDWTDFRGNSYKNSGILAGENCD